MTDQRPFPKSDIRIGHRGLERRDFDDTFWLNGTQIDHAVYNQELQRMLAHADEQKTAQELRQRQAYVMQQAYDAAHEQQIQSAMIGNVFYSHSYPRLYGRPTTAESDQSGERTRANSAQAAQEANAALQAKLSRHAKAEPPRLTLKTSPLFGREAMGPFYNWNFDSPFKPLHRWLVRWAWQHLRHARAS